MADQEIKDLIRARGRVQASLTRVQTFLQQYDESQDVLNIKLRMERLQEIWKKYEEIQDRLEVIHCDPSKHDEFRNDFETKFYDLNVKMQHIIDKQMPIVVCRYSQQTLENGVVQIHTI
jgi:predicted nuclease with TOPRIM domain